jgi:hypothetical protein
VVSEEKKEPGPSRHPGLATIEATLKAEGFVFLNGAAGLPRNVGSEKKLMAEEGSI